MGPVEELDDREGLTPEPGTFVKVDANRVRLLRDGRQAFPAMLEAISAAKSEILFEMYWFQGDRAGHMFRDALTAKAREGVGVRVSYDAVGSIGLPSSLWAPLIEAGGQVYEFGPLAPFTVRFRLGKLNFRDHRKVLVVDAKTAFTGGMNIGDQWLTREDGGEDWRDDAIEVRGPAAEDLRTLFFETWRRTGRVIPRDVGRLSRKVSGRVMVLTNTHGRQRGIRHAYLTGIRSAKSRIDICNPYFLPGPIFLSALYAAQKRGVEVRILIPGLS
ncbi:MAG TPA: phospholipase D-like domain-containing protein, partial [Polyangiaceae bacterium]